MPVIKDYAEMAKRTWYISGPMAGYPDHNFPAFEAAAEAIRALGLDCLSAHEIVHDEEVQGGGTLAWEEYLTEDIRTMLEECNGIILLKGWPQSRGARAELDVALTLGWPVYYYEDFVLTNMNKRS